MSAPEQTAATPSSDAVFNEKAVDNGSPSDQNSVDTTQTREWTHEEEIRARTK